MDKKRIKNHLKKTTRKIEKKSNSLIKGKKKYWLKFGEVFAIIGLLICLISMIVLLSYNSKCNDADNCMIDAPSYIKASYSVFSICSYPIIEFIKSGKMYEITYIILSVLILIIEYFVIGAVIGLIYGAFFKNKLKR